MTSYEKLSESDLQKVIEDAERALKNKLSSRRKEVIAQIRELAASIGVMVEIIESEKKISRKGVKVPIKYRHPQDPEKAWTGRGMMPRWLKALVDEGRKLSDFEVKKQV